MKSNLYLEYDHHFDQMSFNLIKNLTPAKQRYIWEFICKIYHKKFNELPDFENVFSDDQNDKKENKKEIYEIWSKLSEEEKQQVRKYFI